MRPDIRAIEIPASSQASRYAVGAYFGDCFEIDLGNDERSTLELFLAVAAKTPGWVNRLMALRNRTAALFGLKNLGHMGAMDASKPAADYRVGDRIGVFTLLQMSEREVVLGDSDKHLDVRIFVCKLAGSAGPSAAVSTVVHVHNLLGKTYMLFVAPVHKLIVPAMLAKLRT